MGLRGCLTVAGRWAGHIEAASECGRAWDASRGAGSHGAAPRSERVSLQCLVRVGLEWLIVDQADFLPRLDLVMDSSPHDPVSGQSEPAAVAIGQRCDWDRGGNIQPGIE